MVPPDAATCRPAFSSSAATPRRSSDADPGSGVVVDRDVRAAPPSHFKMTKELPVRASLEFEKRPRDPAVGIAFVADQKVVHVNDGPFLENRLDEIEER